VTVLDELNDYHPDLWALGKVKAYSLQTEPFIHADGDVFVWKRFDENIEKAPLIAQNEEVNYGYYKKSLIEIQQTFHYKPDFFSTENDMIKAANAGIFGGNDIDFFQNYCKASLDFVNKNKNCLEKCTAGYLNMIFEQYLFWELAHQAQTPIKYFIEEEIKESDEFKHLLLFEKIPYTSTYLHIIGSAKKSILGAERVCFHLRSEFPAYYYHILKLLDQNQI
jgi:hypothetical protein